MCGRASNSIGDHRSHFYDVFSSCTEGERMPLVELIETRNQADIVVIQSLLESEGIPFFVENEEFTAIRPLVGSVRIRVPEEHLAEAQALIAHLES